MTYEETSSDTNSPDPDSVSENFVNFFAALAGLRRVVSSAIGNRHAKPMLKHLTEEVALRLPEAAHISAANPRRSAQKLRQLMLDVRFFQAASAATQCSTPSIVEATEDMVDAAILEFQGRNRGGKEPRPTDEWFTTRIGRVFEEHAADLGLSRNR